MDECIHTGVSTSETTLPGRLRLRRRAPMLYRRLMRGFYPGVASPATRFPRIEQGWRSGDDAAIDAPEDFKLENSSEDPLPESGFKIRGKAPAKKRIARVVGSFDHAILPMPPVSFLLSQYYRNIIMTSPFS